MLKSTIATVRRKYLSKKDKLFLDTLRIMAPGTPLREALSYILQSGNGGLIVLGNTKRVLSLSTGGFKIDVPFSPTHCYELSKMDGAIILNSDATRILWANRFLEPSTRIPSQETGTRHRAAERLAKQTGNAVIAISEKRSTMTVYVGDRKHIMDNIQTVHNKAAQAVQALEKNSLKLASELRQLSIREFENTVTIFDVVSILQRVERTLRIADEIELFIVELGTEGKLIEEQLKELLGTAEEGLMVIDDYYVKEHVKSPEEVQERLFKLKDDELMEPGCISQALGYGSNIRAVDTYIVPRGYRILTLTRRLPRQIIEILVDKFKNLQNICNASRDELVKIEKIGDVMAERIRTSLEILKNQLMLEYH